MPPVVPPVVPPAVNRPTDQNETGVFAAAASGSDGTVVLFDAAGTVTLRLQAFTPAEAPGGVRAVVADFTGDGVPDFAVGTGPGVPAAVRIYDGVTQKLVS